MIKRSSLKFINKLLEENKSWKVLDVGCGYTANKNATTLCDVLDLQNYYPDKEFVKLESKNLPFKDNEFDFVIASHVLEHVKEANFFINELERVSKKGYIELPTKLEDNLVFENKKDHLWHMDFDDVESKLLISKKIQYIEPVLTVSTIKKFDEIFRKSLIIELYWEDKIDYKIVNQDQYNIKISIFSLLRKYFSKKLRMFFK